MTSLEHIKAGDEIAVPIGISGREHAIERVERVTATQIVTSHAKWRRSDGRLIGSSGWSTSWAVPVTDDIRARAHRRALVRYLMGVDWGAQPIEMLERVHKTLTTGQ